MFQKLRKVHISTTSHGLTARHARWTHVRQKRHGIAPPLLHLLKTTNPISGEWNHLLRRIIKITHETYSRSLALSRSPPVFFCSFIYMHSILVYRISERIHVRYPRNLPIGDSPAVLSWVAYAFRSHDKGRAEVDQLHIHRIRVRRMELLFKSTTTPPHDSIPAKRSLATLKRRKVIPFISKYIPVLWCRWAIQRRQEAVHRWDSLWRSPYDSI